MADRVATRTRQKVKNKVKVKVKKPKAVALNTDPPSEFNTPASLYDQPTDSEGRAARAS